MSAESTAGTRTQPRPDMENLVDLDLGIDLGADLGVDLGKCTSDLPRKPPCSARVPWLHQHAMGPATCYVPATWEAIMQSSLQRDRRVLATSGNRNHRRQRPLQHARPHGC